MLIRTCNQNDVRFVLLVYFWSDRRVSALIRGKDSLPIEGVQSKIGNV